MASLFDQILSSLKSAAPTRTGGGATFAMPLQMPQQFSSVLDMIRPPQQAQFNVTQATGTKPKNYTPASIQMNNVPVASVFGLPGASPPPANPFTVIPATGTKPKNYQPTQILMNAPSLAGPQAMQQMLAMMGNGYGATPFSPYGQQG